jgi:hypothetical protein
MIARVQSETISRHHTVDCREALVLKNTAVYQVNVISYETKHTS